MLCLFGGEYLGVSTLVFYMNLCSCGMLRPSKLVDPFVNKTKVESYKKRPFCLNKQQGNKNLRKTQKSIPKHPKNMVPGCFLADPKHQTFSQPARCAWATSPLGPAAPILRAARAARAPRRARCPRRCWMHLQAGPGRGGVGVKKIPFWNGNWIICNRTLKFDIWKYAQKHW